MLHHHLVVLATSLVLAVLAHAENPAPAGSDLPPASEWIRVDTVPQEYDHIAKQRCTCGGRYREGTQGTGQRDGRHYDRIDAVCTDCGRKVFFTFDVTGIFERMELAGSKSAKAQAVAELNRRYPKIAPELLPELKEVLTHENVHYRVWAIGAIAQIPTEEARELLVRGYVDSSVITGIEVEMAYEAAIETAGAWIVPVIDRTLKDAQGQTHWKLADVLARVRTPQARAVLERELRSGPQRSKRICAISLGRLGYKESQPALLEEFRRTEQKPGDALVWALGRCGGQEACPVLRKLSAEASGVTRKAAIAALGLAGDRDSIPKLLELARSGPAELRRHAVYALGKLRATEAVPLLLDLAATPPVGSFEGASLQGVYDDDLDSDYSGNAKALSIRALGDIADARAIPFFREALASAAYDWYGDKLAQAAGVAGWKQLVPEIIARFAKEYASRAEYYKDHEVPELYSPALRKLTGQTFGEDPLPWQTWLALQDETQPATQPATQSTTRPATQPESQSTTQPVTQPPTRPPT